MTRFPVLFLPWAAALAAVGSTLLAAGCAGPSSVPELGRECESTADPVRRLELVRRIVDFGDERSIPVLIDCLEAARRQAKKPDRVYGTVAVEPNETVPPEFWGLHVITGQDFDMDEKKWRDWYGTWRGRLVWDGGTRRFRPR